MKRARLRGSAFRTSTVFISTVLTRRSLLSLVENNRDGCREDAATDSDPVRITPRKLIEAHPRGSVCTPLQLRRLRVSRSSPKLLSLTISISYSVYYIYVHIIYKSLPARSPSRCRVSRLASVSLSIHTFRFATTVYYLDGAGNITKRSSTFFLGKYFLKNFFNTFISITTNK